MVVNDADDNDVMMLKEQIGNSFRMETRQMNSKNVVFYVHVRVLILRLHAKSIRCQVFFNNFG